MSKFSVELVENNTEIEQIMLKAMLPELDKILKKSFNKIQAPIKNLVVEAIRSAPEYNSILSGDLKYEFGLPDSDNRLKTLLDFWKHINLIYNPPSISNNKIVGSFSIGMIQDDFSDVLSSSAAILTTEKGQDLHWLEWLLLFGDKTIIKNYDVEFGTNSRSRTGFAVMRGSSRFKWGVPKQFSGTINNNWITRSIDSIDGDINKILIESLK